MKLRAASLVAFALSLSGARAQPLPEAPPPAPLPAPQAPCGRRAEENSTAHRHLGFYLRGDLGIGHLRAAEGTGGIVNRVSGGALGLGLAVGGAFAENNILAVHVFEVVHSTRHNSNGASYDTGYGIGGIGPQFTHYFMPLNLYLSGTVALTQALASSSLNDGTGDGNRNSLGSNAGVGTQLSIGKEWWVSRHWGVGVNGSVTASVNGDPTPAGTTTLTTGAFLFSFSATYN